MKPADLLTIGRSIDLAVSKAVEHKDQAHLETLRQYLRNTASKIDGHIQGIQAENKK